MARARRRPRSPALPTRAQDLDVVQRWFQSVITHPGGVEAGIGSKRARRLILVRPDDLETMIRPSRRLAARDRLAVYANAYYARLLECLGGTFPVLKRALGAEAFHEFAFGYLQRYPSRSYTLNRLADRFVRYLEETRPDGEAGASRALGWPDFLIDLARLEWTVAQVFDGPGIEGKTLLDARRLRSIRPERWPEARLVPAVCLKLLRFRYPVNRYYTAARRAKDGEPVPIPEPADEFVAITRRDYIVRRHELTWPQFILLDALQRRRTVGQAIRRSAGAADIGIDELAASLRDWFRDWTAAGFFEAVESF